MNAVVAPPALKGFDVDQPLTTSACENFRRAGYSFAVRYVRRTKPRSSDISAREVTAIGLGGLGLMLVQHVESAVSWVPSMDKGRAYGDGAVQAATEVGYPKGCTLWLDLEGVAAGVSHSSVISYCNYWHDRVALGGWQPGVYVGWHSGLTADELYRRLKFTRYWAAYNLNADQVPSVRGVCMRQRTQIKLAGTDFSVDPNLVVRDSLGGLPTLAIPDEWVAS